LILISVCYPILAEGQGLKKRKFLEDLRLKGKSCPILQEQKEALAAKEEEVKND